MPGPYAEPSLTIAGHVVDWSSDAPEDRIQLDSLTLSCDEADTFEFHATGLGIAGSPYHPGDLVVFEQPLDDGSGGVLRFAGEINRIDPRAGETGYVIGYSCLGLRYLADKITISNPGSPPGALVYNVYDQGDPDYSPSLAGLSVGQILQQVLDLHAAQLAAISPAPIAGYVSSDFTVLTTVPPEACNFSGPILGAIDNFLEQWAGHVCCLVRYEASTSDWRIRFLDTTAFADEVLTLGVDPISPPDLGRDTSTSAPRVVVRGSGLIQGVELSLARGDLFEAFPDPSTGAANPTGDPTVNAAAKLAWSESSYTQPNGATDHGTVTSVGSTTVTVRSSDGTRVWATNFWSTNKGWVTVKNSLASDLTAFESRRVISCTAMSGGSTAVLTVDTPFQGSTFDSYSLVGTATAGALCWRPYGIANADIAEALVQYAPTPVPYWSGNSGQYVSTPIATVYDGLVGIAAPFTIDRVNHQLLFNQPVVNFFGTHDNLARGGASTDGIPTDIVFFALYKAADLEAAWPPDGYGGAPSYDGTSFTVDGIQRTWVYDVGDGFSNIGDFSKLQALAKNLWQTVSDSVVSGTVLYHDKWVPGLTLGIRLSILPDPTDGEPSGLETLKAPVRAVTLEWPQGGGDIYRTHLHLDNRRKMATGADYYTHGAHARAPQSFGFGGGLLVGGLAGLGGGGGFDLGSGFNGGFGSESGGGLATEGREGPREAGGGVPEGGEGDGGFGAQEGQGEPWEGLEGDDAPDPRTRRRTKYSKPPKQARKKRVRRQTSARFGPSATFTTPNPSAVRGRPAEDPWTPGGAFPVADAASQRAADARAFSARQQPAFEAETARRNDETRDAVAGRAGRVKAGAEDHAAAEAMVAGPAAARPVPGPFKGPGGPERFAARKQMNGIERFKAMAARNRRGNPVATPDPEAAGEVAGRNAEARARAARNAAAARGGSVPGGDGGGGMLAGGGE